MPEHLRALVVILGLAAVVFTLAKGPACALAMAAGDFERRRNLWFAITLIAFLSHNFWIYIIVVLGVLLFAVPREPNKFAMFYFLLFAVPLVSAQIPGLGPIDHFFTIHYVRLLCLVVLLPVFFSLWKQPGTEPLGRSLPDKLLVGYLLLNFLLHLQVSTFTNALRHGVFYAFIEIFLPYYVASRSLRKLQDFREALMAFVVAAMVMSAIGAFESARQWLLYASLDDALGLPGGAGTYLRRGENLRALGATGNAIALGYVFAVATGFHLYLRKVVPNPLAWGLGLVLLGVGLVSPLSRGPWVGAAAILAVFIVTGRYAGVRLAVLGTLSAIVLVVLLASPLGQTIIAHLPFVGTIDERNVVYRQRLMEISIQVIMQNPFFGEPNFRQASELQVLRQGQGIIDVVNTYLRVGMESGLVGLSLFAGFFISVGASIFRSMRHLHDRNSELHLLGQGILATLLGILIIIFTVSSVSIIPVIYWSVAGLGVAYATMSRVAIAPQAAIASGFRTPPATSAVRPGSRV